MLIPTDRRRADAVALAKQLDPDVVLMDLRMPVLGGLDATRLIKDACPTTLRLIPHQAMVCRRSLLPPAGSSPVET